MKCKIVRNKALDYLESGHDPIEHGIIGEHLKNCPECRHYYEYVAGVTESVSGNKKTVASPYFFTHLIARMEKKELRKKYHPARSFKKLIEPALITLSFILAVYTGIVIGTTNSGNSQAVITSDVRNLRNDTDLYSNVKFFAFENNYFKIIENGDK